MKRDQVFAHCTLEKLPAFEAVGWVFCFWITHQPHVSYQACMVEWPFDCEAKWPT